MPAGGKGTKSKSGKGREETGGGNWQGERERVRILMQKLSKARIDNMGLRRDLKLAASKRDTVDRETFVEQIVGSVEGHMNNKAEQDLSKAVDRIAKMFPGGKKNDEVDYQQFLEVYARYEELFKATGLIFSQFDTLMEKHGFKTKDNKIGKDSLEKLVEKFTKKKSRGKLTSEEAAAMFTSMLLRLESWELELVCEEFDPTGKGAYLDLDLLGTQFSEWAVEKEAKDFNEKTGGKYKEPSKPYPESDSDDDFDKMDEKAFDGVMEKIAKEYFAQKVDDKTLFKRFEDKNGRSKPNVDSTQFITAVREATSAKGGDDIYLNKTEAKLL